MTQTVSHVHSGRTMFNPRLQELLDNGNFDWDDLRHRTAFLQAWITRPLTQYEEES
jgi:hypothetical protein